MGAAAAGGMAAMRMVAEGTDAWCALACFLFYFLIFFGVGVLG